MKKAFLLASLALVVASSWAFYPKAAAEPGGYMMIVGKIYDNNIYVTTTTSDGQYTDATTPIIKLKYMNENLHKAELLKLNELRQSGWRVVSTTAILMGTARSTLETTYLLEKP